MLMLGGAPLERRESPLARRLQHGYGRSLTGIVRRPLPALLATIAIIATGVLVLPRLGESLFPTFKERDFLIHFVSPPGTSIGEESRIVSNASCDLLAIPGVRDFGSHIGRAVGGEEVNDVNFGEMWVSIGPKADYEKTLAAIQRVAGSYPGVYVDVQTYLRERSKETLTGAGEVWVDLQKAQSIGLKPGDVRRAASTLVAGEEVGTVLTNSKTYDVFVWGTAGNRRHAAAPPGAEAAPAAQPEAEVALAVP